MDEIRVLDLNVLVDNLEFGVVLDLVDTFRNNKERHINFRILKGDMHNLRKLNGTYKGLIGECMFKLTRKWAVIPRFFNKNKYLTIFGKYLSKDQLAFIQENWYSLDSIEVSFDNDRKEIILFEIKMKNKYRKELGFKPKMTLATHQMYESAKQLGFVVKLATVILHNDWNYSIELSEFCKENYYIDSPKKYDKE